MKYLAALVLLFLAATLTASLVPYVNVLGVTPDFVLVIAACWAMIRGQREAMAVVPLAGLLRDVTTSDPIGTSILALSPIVVLAAIRDIRPVESEFIPAAVVVAAASLSYSLLSMTVLAAVGDDVPWGTGLLRVALPSMLINPLFAVLVYPPMRWLSPPPRKESFGVGSAVHL